MKRIAPYALAMGYRDHSTGQNVIAQFTIKCSWCDKTVREGHPRLVSHGMCLECEVEWKRQAMCQAFVERPEGDDAA